MTVPPLLKQKRSTMSADESRLQLNGALEEHVLVNEQSDNEGEQVTDNDDGSQHEQEQAQCDTDYGRLNDVPQCELVRRSTRNKRAPKTLTYESLGQPSYQPQGAMNAIEIYGTLSMPVWGIHPGLVSHYVPYTGATLCRLISYMVMMIPYSAPSFVY